MKLAALFLVLSMTLVLYFAYLLTDWKNREIAQQLYTPEPYTLPDGTPCIILRGTYSNTIGVTCNYQAN